MTRYLWLIEILQNSEALHKLKDGFFDRQNYFHERNQKKREELYLQEQLKNCPFKPEINLVSRQLAEGEGARDLDEKVRKLAIVDKEKHEVLLQKLQDEEQAKYSFKPVLNKKSEALAQNRDASQLMDWEEREKRRLEKLKVVSREQLVEEEKMRECRFVPETSKSRRFEHVESNYSQKNYDAKIQEYLRRRQIEHEMERGQAVFKELQDCTFKPRLNEKIEAETAPIADQVVRGLDFVKKKRDLALKLRQDKADREKQVFDFVSKYDSNPVHKAYTVPEPFNLSKVTSPDQSPAKFEKPPSDFLQQHPFQPVTNHALGKKKLDDFIRLTKEQPL